MAWYSSADLARLRSAKACTPPCSSIQRTVRPNRYQFQVGGVLSMESRATCER